YPRSRQVAVPVLRKTSGNAQCPAPAPSSPVVTVRSASRHMAIRRPGAALGLLPAGALAAGDAAADGPGPGEPGAAVARSDPEQPARARAARFPASISLRAIVSPRSGTDGIPLGGRRR